MVPMAAYSGGDARNPVIGDALYDDLVYNNNYARALYAIDNALLSHPDPEKGQRAMKLLVRDMPGFMGDELGYYSVIDTPGTVERLWAQAYSSPGMFGDKLIHHWELGLGWDDYHRWFNDLGADSTFFDPNDAQIVNSDWPGSCQDALVNNASQAAWDNMNYQALSDPSQAGIFEFATAWAGSFPLMDQLGLNYPKTDYYSDPEGYCNALANQTGSLDFSIEGLNRVVLLDPQVLASNTGPVSVIRLRPLRRLC